MLDLLNTIVPGSMPKSKYYLNKCFTEGVSQIGMHYYCHQCQAYTGRNVAVHCTDCGHVSTTNKSDDYFLVLPLKKQLKTMFETTNIHDDFKRDNCQNGVLDIIRSGLMYGEAHFQEFIQSGDNISLTCHCDDVPVFSSSGFSIWPIFCTINELPDSRKSENIILHTLWFGKKKPRPDTFLKPFVDEMIRLHDEGFNWILDGRVRVSKVVATLVVADGVARPMVQFMSEYNGRFGCGFCEHEGKVVVRGNGHSRVYPLEEDLPPRRTHKNTVAYARIAVASGKPYRGVKGASPLLLLPCFDIIRGFCPEYMHSVLLGVVRQFVNLWLESPGEAFSLRCHHVDQFLIQEYPPSEVKRSPRSIEERKQWKASEWRSFLLLYSPVVLSGLLPRKFFCHWMLLVYAMQILLSKSVTSDLLQKVHLALSKFVFLVPNLYSEQQCTYNVHLLTHLCQCARDWGPLCTTSAFIFEDASGHLGNLRHDTKAVQIQMFRNFMKVQLVHQFAKRCLINAPGSVRKCYAKLLGGNTESRYRENEVGCSTLGKRKAIVLSLQHKIAVEECIGKQLAQTQVQSAQRVIIQGVLFTTWSYSSQRKRNNSCMCLPDGRFVKLDTVVCLQEGIILIVQEFRPVAQVSAHDAYVNVDLTCMVNGVLPQGQLFGYHARGDIKKCCLVKNGSAVMYLVKLPTFEIQ